MTIPENVYTIGRGAHYAKLNGRPLVMKPFAGSELTYWCKLDKGAIYDHKSNDQYDWNKLPGFTPCTIHHQEDSCRIGWRWNLEKECIELCPYVYVNGQRLMLDQHILEVQPEEWFGIKIEFTDFVWEVKMVKAKKGVESPISKKDADRKTLVEVSIPAERCETAPARLQLNFYFGGNLTAPHPVKMHMRPLTQWN